MGTQKEAGHVGPKVRGSRLVTPDHDSQTHEKQPHGHPYLHGDGVDVAAHHRGGTQGGMYDAFRAPAANEAHGYGHGVGQRKGVHRLSGHPGAHMVGQQHRDVAGSNLHHRRVKSK